MKTFPISPHQATTHEWTWEQKGWLFATFWLIFLYNPIAATVTSDAAIGWRVLSFIGIGLFTVLYVTIYRFETRIVARVGLRGLLILIALLTLPALATVPAASYVALSFVPYFGACGFTLMPYRYGFAITTAGILVIVGTAWWLGNWWLLFFLLWLAFASFPAGLGRYMGEKSTAQGIAMHRAQMAENRDRMARDMHDVLGHTLTVLSVKAELAEKLLDKDMERARTELREVQSMTRQALAEVRSTVSGLRVARLDDEVADAERACAASGIVLVVPEDAHVVDPQHRITLAWALRESVTNVVRHAKASRVEVSWGSNWLEVRDDGVGLRGRREGNGLAGVRERVEEVGGQLCVESGEGSPSPGTVVKVQL